MTENATEKKGVNWGAIILALVAITAGRFVFAAMNGDLKQEPSESIVSAEELGIDFSSQPIAIDVFNDGRIIVDGSVKTLKEIQASAPKWKESHRIVSFYRQPTTENESAEISPALKAVMEAGVPFSPRHKPQRGEQVDADQPTAALDLKSE